LTCCEEACSVAHIEWISRFWRWLKGLLRRLDVGDPEYSGPSDEEIGAQLRRFFIELLEGTNLREYRSERTDYIGRRVVPEPEHREDPEPGSSLYLSPEAVDVLNSAPMHEIERYIQLVTGSGGCSVICVVYPPD
jgi:hypothetical protein